MNQIRYRVDQKLKEKKISLPIYSFYIYTLAIRYRVNDAILLFILNGKFHFPYLLYFSMKIVLERA